MTINRRELLTGFGGLAAMTALRVPARVTSPQGAFPRKADFMIEEGYTYLNAAYTHSIPRVSVEAAQRAAEGRGTLKPTASPSGRAVPTRRPTRAHGLRN